MTSNRKINGKRSLQVKRLLQAALLSAFALAPLAGSSVTARADSPAWKNHDRRTGNDHHDRKDREHRDKDHRDKGHHDKDHRREHNRYDHRDKDHRRDDRHHNNRRDRNRYDYRYDHRYNGGYYGGYGNGYGSGYGYGSEFEFSGVVVDRDKRSNTVRVRASNGRTYTVRSGEADRLDRGDHVRVRGYVRNGVLYASDIDRR